MIRSKSWGRPDRGVRAWQSLVDWVVSAVVAAFGRMLPARPCVGCLVFFATLMLLTPAVALSAPRYDILNIGLTSSEHTRNDGYQNSRAQQLNEAGQVLGYSQRYNGGAVNLGLSTWLYDGTTTFNIGLTGSEHTRNDGSQGSAAKQLSEAGQVIGYSARYNGSHASLGRSAWLYDGATTLNIGLTGSEHTRSDGYQYSIAEQLNEAGQVRGYAWRYNGATNLGTSVWLYDGATTLNIGLTGSEHTRNDGYQYSVAEQLNEAGQVSGYADRYNGGDADVGKSAWLYDGVTTLNIGLTGSEHTRSDGFQYSVSQQLNEAGQVSGASARYNGGAANLGTSVWLYDGATTHNIGLTGSGYTRNDGYQYSFSDQLNEAGQVSGYSARFNGGAGYSAWLYDGATTLNIGLTGSEHTRNDGYQYVIANQLNEAGQVTGVAERHNGGAAYLGYSAWLYDGATTLNIGLTGSEYTRNDGYKNSHASQLNEAGQVSGYAWRYNGGATDLGISAWLYDGATTLNIGLTGSEYTRNDGYQHSFAEQLNEAGQVTGYSDRYSGGATDLGQDAWVYDPILGTVSLQLAVRDDGYAYSTADFLGEDGVVLGTYTLYSGMGLVGQRAFYWAAADGLWDLGLLVDGGLPANGWDALYQSIQANGLGYIEGFGRATNVPLSSQSAFLLVPVPEPSGVVLAGIGACGLIAVARRRRTLGRAA